MGLRRTRITVWLAILSIAAVFWQAAAARAVINSAVFPAAADTHIVGNREINNYGASNIIRVESNNGGGGADSNSRALARFDISTLPAGATIEAAALRLWLASPPAASRNHIVYRLQSSWLEGRGKGQDNNPGRNGATWIERQYGNNIWTGGGPWDWASKGGDYLGASIASLATPVAPAWMSWNMVGDVQAFYGGVVPNYGWLIKDNAEDSAVSYRGDYASKTNAGATLRPSLVVTYLKTGAGLSTDTVPIGWYGPIQASFTNTAGTSGDHVSRVSLNIPAGWGQIPTTAGAYAITAPGGKNWAVSGPPAGSSGPQTISLSAATGADDLAPGETLDLTFNLRAPWVQGDTVWTFSTVGAAGGSHAPANWTMGVTTGTLDFLSGGDQTLNPINLTGYDSSTSGGLGTISVRDGRGTAVGWSITISSSDFALESDPAQILPASGFFVPVAPAVVIVDGSSPPVAGTGSLAGAGLALLNAPAGSGVGEFLVTPELELQIPADSISGTYSATITETIIGGL